MEFASDDQLIEALRCRDPSAWGEVYKRLSDQVFGYLLNQSIGREEAEDLTAQTFLEAIKAADRFVGGFPELRAWIHRIARNNLIDSRRKSLRAPVESLDALPYDNEPSSGSDPETDVIKRLEVGRVRKAIERLSTDQRDVLLLRLTQDLTAAEIGSLLGKSPGAVKALVHRGLKALARELERKAPRRVPE